MTSSRPTYYEWRKENFPLEYAHRLIAIRVNAAVRRGEIIKPTLCNRCGEEPAPRDLQGHHADYNKPLEVEWLCRRCHAAHHKAERAAADAERRARRKDPRYRISG